MAKSNIEDDGAVKIVRAKANPSARR